MRSWEGEWSKGTDVTAETLPGAGAARSVETVSSAVVDSTGGAVISGVSAVGARSGEVVRSWAEGLSENGGCAGDGGRAAVAGDSGALDVSTVSSTRTGKYWDPGPDDVNCWAAVVRRGKTSMGGSSGVCFRRQCSWTRRDSRVIHRHPGYGHRKQPW